MKQFALVFTLLSGAAVAKEPDLKHLTVGLEALTSISLTPARTQGGIGGAVDVSFAFTPSWQAHIAAAWLTGIGSNSLIRLGGAWTKAGTWRPLFGADIELGFGGSLNFGPVMPEGVPTVGLAARIALLRFELGKCTISALEINAGPSTEFVSVGWRIGLKFFALSVSLPQL